MAFLLSELRAPADQEVYLDFDESEYEEMVSKLIVIHQAICRRTDQFIRVQVEGSRWRARGGVNSLF